MGPRPGDGEAVVGVPLVLTRDGKALVAGLGWGGKLEASPAPPNNWFCRFANPSAGPKAVVREC